MKRIAITILAFALSVLAQTPASRGNAVTLSRTAPLGATQKITVFDAGNNPTFVCEAASDVGESVPLAIASATNANPAVLTVTAGHKFDYQSAATATPLVKLSGFTGNWAVLNGVFVATPTSATAFSVPVDSGALGAMAGSPILTTRSPRPSDPVWAVQKTVYDANNNPIWTGWAVKAPGAGSTVTPPASAVNYGYQCLNLTTRTDYAYQ